jgi:hypothetical protein
MSKKRRHGAVTGLARILRPMQRVNDAYRIRFGLDGNPLRRRTDRWEAGALAGAVASVLAGLAGALVAAMLTWHTQTATHRLETATRQPVSVSVVAIGEGATWGRTTATVTWKDVAGKVHRAQTADTTGAGVGARITMWLDPSGNPVDAPLSVGSVLIDSIGVGLGVTAGALLLTVTGYRLVRRRLDAVRHRQWDAEWLELNRVAH